MVVRRFIPLRVLVLLKILRRHHLQLIILLLLVAVVVVQNITVEVVVQVV
jgi:hypothetical protein